MPKIVVTEPLGTVIDSLDCPEGISFADAVMKEWPDGYPDHNVKLFDPSGVPLSPEMAVLPMQPGTYRIVLYPLGPVILGVKLGVWLLAAVSLAGSILLAPKIPNLGQQGNYEWDEEARPQFLSGQTNQIRPGARVVDLFGAIRTYPDLIAQPVIEYYGDYQSIRELYVVTNGYAECSDYQLQENSMDDLPAYGATQFRPGDTWPIEFPILRQNEYVGQVDLPAPNEVAVTTPNWTLNTGGTITVAVDGFFSQFVSRVGQAFYIFSPSFNPANNKVYTLVSISTDGRTLTVSPAPSVTQTVTSPRVTVRRVTAIWGTVAAPNTFTPTGWNEQWPVSGNFTGYTANNQIVAGSGLGTFLQDITSKALNPATGQEYSVSKITTRRTAPGGVFEQKGQWLYHSRNSPQPPAGVAYVFVRMENPVPPYDPDVPNTGYNSPVFNVPGSSTKEIWLDFEFPQGLYYQVSGQPPQALGVTVDVFYRAAASSDPWVQHPGGFTFVATTRNPRRWTSKITGLPIGAYEVYLSRRTNTVLETSSAFAQDTVRLIGLKGVQDTPKLVGLTIDYTMIELAFYTQNISQAFSNRRFNCIAQRYLPNHRTGDGTVLEPTRRLTDAILYTAINQEQYDKANIDVAALTAIQAELDALDPLAASGEFNGIFDQIMTTEDQLLSIANVGRIMVYRKARNLFFKRPKAGELPVTLFNSRNKTQPEQKVMTFGETNDPDAIIVRYVDETQGYAEGEIQYPQGVDAVRPKTITLLGVTSPLVAYRRAKYEWDLITYQRDSISLAVAEEGILVGPGDVIANSDFLHSARPLQGEVLSVAGTVFTFDRNIPAGSYIGRIRSDDGFLLHQSNVTIATAGDVQDIPAWTGAVMPGGASSVGLLYEFVSDTAGQQDLYLVSSVAPDADGIVNLTCNRYMDEMYACDTAVLPSVLTKRW